ncbi:hypothetical protein [Pseudogemmobacter blasticus]|uniref:Uncharacterized protein n=1 Tax=Fuscovulum blasticum DSM 2131 TaxID=1188250 RepID=A0A2T4JAY9_FUSBL|nr:hypothetical protein [Fuscovulum blasticum]PTE15080.1 hypothetical protein C5F44_07330 [Fuscovulum blasticum DSM 2131]
MRTRFVAATGLATALYAITTAALAAGDDPLSAIDWLSQSVTTQVSAVQPSGTPPTVARPGEPPVSANGALPVDVATTALDAPSPDGVGLIAPAVSGLPRNLWGAGRTDEIAQAIIRDRMSSLPALRQLFLTMLLAEATPPADSEGKGRLLQARVDKLMQIGALEQAAALIEISGAETPDLFRRAFDVALLTGNEDRACAKMQESPGLAPTIQARVFCLARDGQWDAAALTLQTAAALKQISSAGAELLARFLDPDLFDGELMPPPPNPVTPLDWKIYSAIGESLPTASLPVAFSYAEIGQEAGWKAQIEAAERLTRAGTIAPNVILGLYTDRDPAASGGVWDRVAAFQDFDAAMQSRDPQRVAQTLPVVWARMQEVELEVPFAMLYGRDLTAIPLTGEAATIAFRVELLSPVAETAAAARETTDTTERFLIALTRGDLKGVTAPDSMGRAIAPAFLNPMPSTETRALVDGNRTGEAILLAIEEIARGVEGDLASVTRGLSLLRSVGLEGVARRTALELMILERRG